MLICKFCNKSFKLNKMKTQTFCSRSCSHEFTRIHPKSTTCKNCNVLVIGRCRKFCSKACSATYNNKNKSHGLRRSNLEIYLEDELRKLYKGTILFNDKKSIGSELDIFIPDLNVAFELNGIIHYRPIYGEDKFNKIKLSDENKKITCAKLGIKLIVINTSDQKIFSKETSNKYLDTILLYVKV